MVVGSGPVSMCCHRRVEGQNNGDILLFRSHVPARPPARPQTRLQPKPRGGAPRPGGRPEGRAAVYAAPRAAQARRKVECPHYFQARRKVECPHYFPDRISVPGWTGEGYVLFDPQTGDGAYKITGGNNGGFVDIEDGINMLLESLANIW